MVRLLDRGRRCLDWALTDFASIINDVIVSFWLYALLLSSLLAFFFISVLSSSKLHCFVSACVVHPRCEGIFG